MPASAKPTRAVRINIDGLFSEEFIHEMLLEFAAVGNRGILHHRVKGGERVILVDLFVVEPNAGDESNTGRGEAVDLAGDELSRMHPCGLEHRLVIVRRRG